MTTPPADDLASTLRSYPPEWVRPVLSAEAMRSADRYTIEEFGIPGFTLMETAGHGAALAIARHLGPLAGKRVNIYCGKGNNGGDGFVIARYLCDRGARVRVIRLADQAAESDAAAHFRLLENSRNDADSRLTIESYDGPKSIGRADIHVDALLGTGLSSELREPIRPLIEHLNHLPGAKVAVDIPTGIHSDTGRVMGAAFRADWTFTMGASKTGLHIGEGRRYAGRVEVIDIGIPRHALLGPVLRGSPGCALRTSDEIVRSWIPDRPYDANKYSVGLVLVIGGSPGMTGAPAMACSAAARVGAGYVVCGCDERIASTLNVKLTEVTTIPLPASELGLDPDAAVEALGPRLQKAGGVLVGCGLGRSPETGRFVRQLLTQLDGPAVIDADGLNALVDHVDLLREHARGRWILTPHMGEFRRLTGDLPPDIQMDDRVRLARHYSMEWDCVLLLKGLPSVVAAPDGRVWINDTGGTELATAGTGDVLAGMCAGLLAQGLTPEQSAVAGMHIGGAASSAYAVEFAGRSMQATDLIAHLPAILKSRFCSS